MLGTRFLGVSKRRNERVMRRRSHHISKKFCSQAKGERKVDNVETKLIILIILAPNLENVKEQQNSD